MAYKKSIIEKQVYYATIEDASEDAERRGIGIGREEGIGIGREEGIGIGEKKNRDFMIKNLLILEEWPISKIAEVSGQSEAYVKEIQASLK